METVVSKDGTGIAFDWLDEGPPRSSTGACRPAIHHYEGKRS